MDILGLIIYPGLTFLLALAWFYEWLDRRFSTGMHSKDGPICFDWHGLLQSLTDFARLLAKEVMAPRVVGKPILTGLPILILTLPLIALFLVPMGGIGSLVNFEGDLIFAVVIMGFLAILIFIDERSSANRSSAVDDFRAAVRTLHCEVLLVTAALGPAIAAGSLSISRIVQWQATNGLWIFFLTPIGFSIAVLAVIAELEKVPFDISQVETGTIAGWRAEFLGRRLALVRLVHDLELVLTAALLTDLFLGGPSGPISIIPGIIWFLIKATPIVLFLSKLRVLFNRFRIGQMISALWKHLMVLAILQVIILRLLFW